jgi:hypothetical protein
VRSYPVARFTNNGTESIEYLLVVGLGQHQHRGYLVFEVVEQLVDPVLKPADFF